MKRKLPLSVQQTSSNIRLIVRKADGLEQSPDSRLRPVLGSVLLVLLLDLLDALASLFLGDVCSADQVCLALAHTGVDVNVLDLDVERTVLLDHEPRVDLPEEVTRLRPELAR
jgi:hypothetical protein